LLFVIYFEKFIMEEAMQKDTLVLLAKYNKLANEKMDAVIKTLSPQEWDKPLGGFFKSVRGNCSHIYACDFNYLKRFSNLRAFAVFKDAFFGRDPYPHGETLFADMGEYLAKRPELDAQLAAFADELQDEDLGKILKYTTPRGDPVEKNFGGLVMHNFNHDTHHRGMISLYLELLGNH
jgi:uncharacterized damage-inducible protein DinB